MRRWNALIERKISEVIGDGDVSHLPGAGLPLSIDTDGHLPDEWRVAHKLMSDNNVVPEWIARGEALERMETKLKQQISSRAQTYQRDLARAKRAGDNSQRSHLRDRWRRAIADCRERVERYNRELLTYNLNLPAGLRHRLSLDSDALVEQALADARKNGSTPEN